MKPTFNRIESKVRGLETLVQARQKAATTTAQSNALCQRLAGIALDDSLSHQQAAEKIRTLGGRGDERSVAHMRELLDLARQRRAQGWVPSEVQVPFPF